MSKRAVLWLACMVGSSMALPAWSAEYIQGTQAQQKRAYSPGVITDGGRIVWLAGQTATEDLNGKSIAADFEAQTRTIFKRMDQTLKRAGGSLSDLVTMTVFINDPRNGDRFVEIRKEMFPDGHFPGSALLTISNFARPGMMIEIAGIAVIGEKN
jgi:2-iminobutanoate/2-iminopropanoate deaminase